MGKTSASRHFQNIVTVTLHTAVDRVIEVPGFTIGAHLPGTVMIRQPAGKGLNVSRALAALGVPNVATGFVGDDELAQFEASAQPGLLNAQFLSVPGKTRENLTILAPPTRVETHIRTTGFKVAAHDVDRLMKKLNLLAKHRSLVVFSGSLPPGMEVADFAAMVDLVLADGAQVAVDAGGETLRAVIDKPLWLIKPNRTELVAAVPETGDDEASILSTGRALSKHVRTVIVTCGAAGSYAFTGGAAFIGQVDLGEDKVVSTVGCGDALLAGFIAAQDRGASIRDAFAYASAVASAAAVNPAPAAFALPDVDKYRSRTSVIPLEDPG